MANLSQCYNKLVCNYYLGVKVTDAPDPTSKIKSLVDTMNGNFTEIQKIGQVKTFTVKKFNISISDTGIGIPAKNLQT